MLAGGLAALPLPLVAQNAFSNDFIRKWVQGSWAVKFPEHDHVLLMEFYGHSPATEQPGSFVLRAGNNWIEKTPGQPKSAFAKPTATGAHVTLTNDAARYEIPWRASDTQEGVVHDFKIGRPREVKLRRLSAAEVDMQRSKVLGEKPLFINTSYFG